MTTQDAAVAPLHPRLAALRWPTARACYAAAQAGAATSGHVTRATLDALRRTHGFYALAALACAGLLVMETGGGLGAYVHAPEVLDRAAALERGDVP